MIVACVRTGNKYPVDYVYKLRDMIARHLPIPHLFVCKTDRPDDLNDLVVVDISKYRLFGWWGKMTLFHPVWRKGERVLYFDLDSVICGDLTPLAHLWIDFGICANFTRAAGNLNWPCQYGSCVMSIGPDKLDRIWDKFNSNSMQLMNKAGIYGDQKVIEELVPSAILLQDVLPNGFFLGYRNLTNKKPEQTSVVVFAGNRKPHNCNTDWIKSEWVRS